MTQHRRFHQFALRLALVATVFGGALMGLGNALDGALSQQDIPTVGYHQHANHSTQTTALIPDILTMPAHCMFCIDGVSPQPATLCPLALSLETRHESLPPVLATATPATKKTTPYRERAPPHLTS